MERSNDRRSFVLVTIETIGLFEQPVENLENLGCDLAPEMDSTGEAVYPTI